MGLRQGGRQKGTPNKTTAQVKAALMSVYDKLGGDQALHDFARENPVEFYRMWSKLLPLEATVTGDVGVTVQIVRFSPEVAE